MTPYRFMIFRGRLRLKQRGVLKGKQLSLFNTTSQKWPVVILYSFLEEVISHLPSRRRVKRLIFMLQTRYEPKRCAAGDTDDNGSSRRDTPKMERRHKMYKRFRCKLPMRLQFFAAGDGAGGAGGSGAPTGGTGGNPPAGTGNAGSFSGNAAGQGQQPPAIDYAKIQQMLDGTLAAKEDTALKAYFKQQGLSQQEAEQAMAAFKQQKAANTPDVAALQTQAAEAQRAAIQANTEKEAMFLAGELGVDLKTMPYVLKLADLTGVADEKGTINKETLKNALNKVLEELPQLKPADTQGQQGGFRQIGSGGQGSAPNVDDQLAAIFGNKK